MTASIEGSAEPDDAGRGTGEPGARLLYLITSGLSARFLRGQLGFMIAAGFEVHVGTNLEGTSAEFDEGVTVHQIDYARRTHPRADLTSLWQTIRLIRQLRPDIVNASTPKAGLLGIVGSWALRVPQRVHVVRGLRYATMAGVGRGLHRVFAKLTIRLATDVVFNSPSLMHTAESDRIVRVGSGRILGGGSGNGIDARRFMDVVAPEEARRELGLPMGVPIVGFIGRFTKDKGVADLVAAFERVSQNDRDARLLLIGDHEASDPIAEDVRTRIETSDAIITRHWTEKPERAYPAMDVLVFPSLREGLPNVVLEAQAAGTPVVGYSAVGTRDAISGTSERLFVPPGDIDGLAAAIVEVLADDRLRELVIAENRRWVAAQFDQQRVWRDLLGVYRRESSA